MIDWTQLGFTSGRRTYLGNKRVGGVANSEHLRGTAADFTAPASALRAQFGPNVRILDEGDHRHVSGLSDVPYYGRNGTAGLVNGIDTSAPKASPMLQPRKRTLGSLVDDPLAPLPQVDQFSQGAPPIPVPQQMQTLADLIPQMPEQQGHKGLFPGKDWRTLASIALGAIGDGLLMNNGQRPMAAPAIEEMKAREFEREKFDAQLQARRQEALQKAAEPPAQIQLADYLNGQPPERQAAILGAMDKLNPHYEEYTDAQGNLRQRLAPRAGYASPAPPAEAVAELKADPTAAAEFDAIFGPGAARRALGY